MATYNPARKTFQIEAAAHERFEAICKKRPVERTMFSAGTRLIEWFCRQKPEVQSAILSDVDVGMEHFYADALRSLISDLEEKAKKSRHTK